MIDSSFELCILGIQKGAQYLNAVNGHDSAPSPQPSPLRRTARFHPRHHDPIGPRTAASGGSAKVNTNANSPAGATSAALARCRDDGGGRGSLARAEWRRSLGGGSADRGLDRGGGLQIGRCG